MGKISDIQLVLGVQQDGNFGNKSWAALFCLLYPRARSVMASSFADPADIAAFKRCKSQGNSDQACFKVGDNGEGFWGDDTTSDVPMCALPREDWKHLEHPRFKPVLVTIGNKEVRCLLADTMPRKANIENSAGIDLNPGAVKAFGLRTPLMVPATWRWA